MKKEDNHPEKTKRFFKTFFNVLMLLVWVGAAIIASQLILGWLMLALVGANTFQKPFVTALYSALSYTLAMVLIIIVPLLLKKQKEAKPKNSTKQSIDWKELRTDLGLKGLPTWTDLGLAPVGFLIYLVLAFIMTFIFSQFAWFDASEAQDVGFNFIISGPEKLIAFLTLVVVAPIAEEIIFRGFLYGRLRNLLNVKIANKFSVFLSIFLTSLLFGIMHMQWNVGVNVFAMSIVLCALREITGTIHAGILLHMLKNGVAFYLLYVLGMGLV